MGNQSKGLIALLQLNPTVGDIVGNAQRLQEMVSRAQSHGASVCVSTELGHLWLSTQRFTDAAEFHTNRPGSGDEDQRGHTCACWNTDCTGASP